MKVIKFGGSSLASATQLEKVLNIVKSDPERRFVVVSAPGKRNDEDTKVTDALIKYYKHYTKGVDVKADQEWIINRYQAMVDELGFKSTEMTKIAKSINDLATLPIEDNDRFSGRLPPFRQPEPLFSPTPPVQPCRTRPASPQPSDKTGA